MTQPTTAWMGFPSEVPETAHTFQGFRDWCLSDEFPERGRVTFFRDQVIVDMSPEELYRHNLVKVALTATLHDLDGERCAGTLFGDGVRFSSESAQLSTVPDALFFTSESLISGEVDTTPREDHPTEFVEVTGHPDWVLEVVSRSSVRKDTVRLRHAYWEAGVREYWVVNAYEEPLRFDVLIHSDDGYVPAERGGEWRRSRVFDRWFRIVMGEDRVGRPRYTVDVRTTLDA
ncbi:MAG: Uma2 family endonuclease [Planctomycetes bacterium]|nr:Uma2 family endonuclease [Planctomycetota bacterium]